MHTLTRTVVVTADPDDVWQVIGRFGGLADWHPLLPPSVIEDGADPETPGAIQAFAVNGQVVIRERLLEKDDSRRMFRYAIQESAVPVSDYVSTLSVHPNDTGAEIRWAATYEATDALVPEIEKHFGDTLYAAGLNALKERFTLPA
ncbi:SRPBCC family protein [Streptomyces sp. LHD-70]|uniref:SRPBCC family protein n=1 Tax=Streptomyces sp. LHD-70 TaxID=3072140 RepID=UPI00280C4087|nr:SRPBCC family protein [Streptomyces sp. LHD-70]MDQ8705290.1 SRPBCC family protein [Streptomyces sp. LHD-70]